LFKRILVPLDGSEHSLRALEIAVQIAKKFDSTLSLIHVYSGAPMAPIFMCRSSTQVRKAASEIIEANRNAGSAILAEGKKRAKTEGVQVETLLREGHAVDVIVKTCRENKIDLIVMGSRGLSKTKKLFLGSVSDGVMRHAYCTVLVVKLSTCLNGKCG